jgi:hypothetical protein
MQACRIKESWSNKEDPSCASTIARWNWKTKKSLHTPLVIQPYFKDILLVFSASISL